MSTLCAIPGVMIPGEIWPGESAASSASASPSPGALSITVTTPAVTAAGGGGAVLSVFPPCGFAGDGRPENARQYPDGRELASNANANLATIAGASLDWERK
jgi:hypothetical protein